MKKVYYNFFLFSSFLFFFSIVGTTNVFAQSKKVKSISKTIEKATALAKKGYNNADANLLFDAIEILLSNKYYKNVSYNISSIKNKQYEKLVDIEVLLKNAEKWTAKNDEKTKKRLFEIKYKYKKWKNDAYADMGTDAIKITLYCLIENEEVTHQITCIKKTAIYIKDTKKFRIAIEGRRQMKNKSPSFYYETENNCYLNIKNDYQLDAEILIYEEEL